MKQLDFLVLRHHHHHRECKVEVEDGRRPAKFGMRDSLHEKSLELFGANLSDLGHR